MNDAFILVIGIVIGIIIAWSKEIACIRLTEAQLEALAHKMERISEGKKPL